MLTSPDQGPEQKCFEMNGVVGVMMDHRIFELMGGANDMFNIKPKIFTSGVAKNLLKK